MTEIPTEPSACPVCGPSVASTLRFRAKDRLHGSEGEYTYHQCAGCGLLFQNPRVRPDAAMRVYPQDYIAHVPMTTPTGFKKVARQVTRWLQGMTLPTHVGHRLNSDSRVLDVGCGAGEFLNEVRTRFGCQVEGLDLSESSKAAAKATFDIEVFCGPLSAAPWAAGSFDLVSSWWSLEHMPDPASAVAQMRSLLRPGGQLLIAVPNAHSLVAQLFGDRWYHLDCPRHYYLWTPSSLRRLLERAGLRHVSTSFDKSPWGLLGSLQYAIFGDNHRPEVANRLRGNTKAALPFVPATIALGLLHYSDTMVMTATPG